MIILLKMMLKQVRHENTEFLPVSIIVKLLHYNYIKYTSKV